MCVCRSGQFPNRWDGKRRLKQGQFAGLLFHIAGLEGHELRATRGAGLAKHRTCGSRSHGYGVSVSKSSQKHSKAIRIYIRESEVSPKIDKDMQSKKFGSYDMCHGPHRTDEKGIATRLAYLLRFSMAEKVITAIAIPSRELKSRKTRLVYQSQWSNPAHKQTFPSRLQ